MIHENKSTIRVALLCLTMMIMAPTAISPIIANMIQSFPATQVTMIQFLLTYPCIIVIIVTLIMGKISTFTSKKVLACIGTLLIAMAGIGAYLFHSNIATLYLWATILGIGIGMTHTNAISLIADYFEGQERGTMMGLQSASGNVGAMIMTLVGGAIASTAWQSNYLVYLLALVGFFTCLFFVPTKNISTPVPEKSGALKNETINSAIFYYVVITIVFLALFNVSPVNFSLIVTERALGGTGFTGTVSGIFNVAGIFSGLLFSIITNKLKSLTIATGYALLCIGYFIIALSSSAFMLLLGAFIGGFSVCIVMSKIYFNVTTISKPTTIAMAIALVTASTNIGSFFAPIFTVVAQSIFHNSASEYRFLLAGIIALLGTIVIGIREKARKVA